MGAPPSCERTVEREVTTTSTVTDMVHFTEEYEVEVESTERVRESYVVWVEESYVVSVRVPPLTRTYMGMPRPTPMTVEVRAAPFTVTERVSYVVQVQESYVVSGAGGAVHSETVRVAPFSETVTGTYTESERYCAQYDLEFGSGCVRWATREVTRTYTEVVDAYNYETRAVFNYEDQVHLRYVPETRYRDVTRDVFNYRTETRTGVRETLITEPVFNYEDQVHIRMVEETRYRWVDRTVTTTQTRTRTVCCRPVTTEVTITSTVSETESAVPDAACTAGYALGSASMCEHPAGADLGDVAYECGTGWAADVDGVPSMCERTVTEAVLSGTALRRPRTPWTPRPPRRSAISWRACARRRRWAPWGRAPRRVLAAGPRAAARSGSAAPSPRTTHKAGRSPSTAEATVSVSVTSDADRGHLSRRHRHRQRRRDAAGRRRLPRGGRHRVAAHRGLPSPSPSTSRRGWPSTALQTAEATPELGATTATVTDDFAVTPHKRRLRSGHRGRDGDRRPRRRLDGVVRRARRHHGDDQGALHLGGSFRDRRGGVHRR